MQVYVFAENVRIAQERILPSAYLFPARTGQHFFLDYPVTPVQVRCPAAGLLHTGLLVRPDLSRRLEHPARFTAAVGSIFFGHFPHEFYDR